MKFVDDDDDDDDDGLHRDGFLRVKRPNQQCQSIEERGFNPTRSSPPCYNNTTPAQHEITQNTNT